MSIKHRPTFQRERALMAQGFSRIVGVDEVGCGALAGPVVAGAVILPLTSRLGALDDSKQVSPRGREELFKDILARADAWAIGVASVEEIVRLGIRPATFLAMRRAINAIPDVQYVLVDGYPIRSLPFRQEAIVRGDARVKSIAAASIVAKVTRDRMMRDVANEFPGYGFERHVGYGTKAHRSAISLLGPCRAHRSNYKLV